MINRRPAPDECAPYYHTYTNKVEGDDIISILEHGKEESTKFLESIPWDKWEHTYAEGKWTIAEVLMHLIDGERIFAYRALRIARNDQTPLPGFEQDDYIPFTEANQRLPASLVREYQTVRDASISLFRHFSEAMWSRRGTASNHPVTPLALAYIIAGHEQHHLNIIRERYL